MTSDTDARQIELARAEIAKADAGKGSEPPFVRALLSELATARHQAEGHRNTLRMRLKWGRQLREERDKARADLRKREVELSEALVWLADEENGYVRLRGALKDAEAELATARQREELRNEQAAALIADKDEAVGQLVVVRRQLAERTKALERIASAEALRDAGSSRPRMGRQRGEAAHVCGAGGS